MPAPLTARTVGGNQWRVVPCDMLSWQQSTGEGPGIDGAIGSVQEHGQHVVITTDVVNLDAARERVVSAGGTITLERMAIPAVGWLIYANDPNGLQFGLLESDRP